jgi:hypothetical protein
MAPIDAVEVADANRDLIVGIKVRVGARRLGVPARFHSTLRFRSPTRPAFR